MTFNKDNVKISILKSLIKKKSEYCLVKKEKQLYLLGRSLSDKIDKKDFTIIRTGEILDIIRAVDKPYWAQILKVFDSPSDEYQSLSLEDLKNACDALNSLSHLSTRYVLRKDQKRVMSMRR